MTNFILTYWPHIVLVITIVASISAAIHAAMTKQDVRAAIGWVAVIIFSPLFGAFFYFIAGINRIRRQRVYVKRKRTEHLEPGTDHDYIEAQTSSFEVSNVTPFSAKHFQSMHRLGDKVAMFPLLSGNSIRLLDGGDET